jgi:peptidyl-prolyl cis-trans isomerase SurA
VKLKFILATLFLIAAFLISLSPVHAQEGEPVVVDEVIAQVNDGVVTLSQLKREMKEAIDLYKQRGMTEQQATAEIEKHRAELIATLINEQLLLQQGKELGMTERVEAEVNKRMLEVAKQNGITSIEKLDDAMRQAGIDPTATRQTLRAEIMKQAVLESEVDSKLFYGLSNDELHKYFDAHRDKFLKPEAVDLSEIFLSLAGKQEAEVKAQAMQLVDQLRKGADFATLAKAYSDRGKENAGKVGLFQVTDLRPDILAAIKNVKAGGVSEPLKTDEGYQILRVDTRTAGTNTPVFNENQVREAITIERSPKAHDEYLQGLRDDAYIKIAKDYSDAVQPLLKIKQDFIVEKSSDDNSKAAPEKKKGRFLGIFPKP